MSGHLYLTGYRGTGKTSVGSIVAQTIGRVLIDLDRLVEAEAGRSIREIFAAGGERSFRSLERAALVAIADQPAAVISLGGGAILSEPNREWIRSRGFCVWLDAAAGTVAERIAADPTSGSQRPPLTELDLADEVCQVLEQRRPLYRQSSDLRIVTDGKTIEQVAAEVVAGLPASFRG